VVAESVLKPRPEPTDAGSGSRPERAHRSLDGWTHIELGVDSEPVQHQPVAEGARIERETRMNDLVAMLDAMVLAASRIFRLGGSA
jgi:hypothetical protein